MKPAVDADASIHPAGFFLLRTPLLPFDTLLEWVTRARASDPASAGAAVRHELRAICAAPLIREAIYLASTRFHARLEHWLAGGADPDRKIERTAARYLSRMAARPMPFGLFAGITVGTIGRTTCFTLRGTQDYQRRSRLGLAYLTRLADELARDRDLASQLTAQPNSSLWQRGERLQYIRAGADDQPGYEVLELPAADHVARTLERARSGMTIGHLAAVLAGDDAEIDLAEATSFVDRLLEHELLVSDLRPSVTGDEPLAALIAALRALSASPCATAMVNSLTRVESKLRALDTGQLGSAVSRYSAIAAELNEISTYATAAELFRVDLIKPADTAAIGPAVVEELRSGIAALRRLSAAADERDLAEFRRRFDERYGQEEVPLVEALDEENGIGFATAPGEPSELEAGWTSRHAFLLYKLHAAWRSDAQEIEIDEDELARLGAESTLPLPEALCVTATIGARSADDLAAGRFRVVIGGGYGPSGINSLARFAHIHADLARHLREYCASEAALHPDGLVAEVVHVPKGVPSHLVLRPVLREWEIPYLGGSGAAKERQIPVTDLLVSVRGQTILLHSRTLGRRVIPRHTTGHNFSAAGPAIYRFLAMLPRQGLAALRFSWGPIADAPALPRVRVGRCVLALAQWRVDRRELESCSIAELRARHRWPRFASVADGEDGLPVDLDNALSVDGLTHMIKQRSTVVLREMYPRPDELSVRGPEGAFVSELMIPFMRASDQTQRGIAPPVAAAARSSAASPTGPRVARQFVPGSEWLYIKLYSGPATIDRLLVDIIGPFSRDILARGQVQRWFFLRAREPEWHLRLRWQGKPDHLMNQVRPALFAALHGAGAAGRVWRVQLESYDREIERYGGPYGIELVEDMFSVDSTAVVAALARLTPAAGPRARWQLGLASVHRILLDMELSLAERTQVTTRLGEILAQERARPLTFNRERAGQFRQERGALARILDGATDNVELAAALLVLAERARQWAPTLSALRRHREEGRLTRPWTELAMSLVHVHCGRLFRSWSRAEEAALYDCLRRLYLSEAARARGHGHTPTQVR